MVDIPGVSVVGVGVSVVLSFRSPFSVHLDRRHSAATGSTAAAAVAAAAFAAFAFAAGPAGGTDEVTDAVAVAGAGAAVVAFPLSGHAEDSFPPLSCLLDG